MRKPTTSGSDMTCIQSQDRRIPSNASVPTLPWLALVAALAVGACGSAPDDTGTGADGTSGREASADAPRILILGGSHLAQTEERVPDAEVAAVVDSLRSYAPDMVVVEYLPADWPYGRGRDYRAELDSLVQRLEAFRARVPPLADVSFIDRMRFYSSPQWIEAQREVYEEVMPGLTYDSAGARQTANYWGRNRRMFEEIEEAVRRERLERILVVVGAGHKYFLDELARERG